MIFHVPVKLNLNIAIVSWHSVLKFSQIVGLTASLGIGNAQNALEAVEHFIKICANLDITVLSYVRENVDELRAFSFIAADGKKIFFFLNFLSNIWKLF